MRAALMILGLALGLATQAFAQPPTFVLPDQSLAERNLGRILMSAENSTQDAPPQLSRDSKLEPPVSSPHLSLGPFSMDTESVDIGRESRRVQFAHIHLDDVHLLGGNVSGTFDGRAATLNLSWPTGR